MNRRGFTLVELLLTLMLTGILFASAGILMTQGLRSYIVLSDRSVALQGVRYAVVKDSLRSTGSGPFAAP